MMSGLVEESGADIVVCVHNGFEDVESCFDSLFPTLSNGDRVVIVDDGSDLATKALCERFAQEYPEKALLIRRETGSGFCKAANEGLRNTTRDTVILLNSDTIVVGDWIKRMQNCLQASPRIGIVGPLSNAGGWQSIPNLPGKNASPNLIKSDLETLRSIHEFCGRFSGKFCYPIVEQVNGFCFAVKRAVLDEVGLFDEVRFPQGYGEESDLNLRAQEAGFLCAVVVDCFVFHSKTKSYTSEQRQRLAALGREQLYELYGEQRIVNVVRGAQGNPILCKIRSISERIFQDNDWILDA